MKWCYFLFMFVALFVLKVNTFAANISNPTSDIFTYQYKGSSNVAIALSNEGLLNMQDGIQSLHESFDTVTMSSIGIINVQVSTTILASRSTTYTEAAFITQPNYPQVLSLWVAVSTTSAAFIPTLSTVTITGLNARGGSITELVVASSTRVNLTNNAFAYISSITWSNLAAYSSPTLVNSTIYLTVGSTGTVGLSMDGQVSDDVYKVRSWGVHATSFTYTPTYDTLAFPSNSPLNKVEVWGRSTTSSPVRRK